MRKLDSIGGVPAHPRSPHQGQWARLTTMFLGAWLFVAAILWRQEPVVELNSLVVGFFIVVMSIWASWMPVIRYVNAGLGAWLALSTALDFRSGWMLWHNVLIGTLVVATSLVPSVPRLLDRPSIRRRGRA
jgi:hypothetical protein